MSSQKNFEGNLAYNKVFPILFRENHTSLYSFPLVYLLESSYLCTIKSKKLLAIKREKKK